MIKDMDAMRGKKCKGGGGRGLEANGLKKTGWCEMFSVREEFVTLQHWKDTVSF